MELSYFGKKSPSFPWCVRLCIGSCRDICVHPVAAAVARSGSLLLSSPAQCLDSLSCHLQSNSLRVPQFGRGGTACREGAGEMRDTSQTRQHMTCFAPSSRGNWVSSYLLVLQSFWGPCSDIFCSDTPALSPSISASYSAKCSLESEGTHIGGSFLVGRLCPSFASITIDCVICGCRCFFPSIQRLNWT